MAWSQIRGKNQSSSSEDETNKGNPTRTRPKTVSRNLENQFAQLNLSDTRRSVASQPPNLYPQPRRVDQLRNNINSSGACLGNMATNSPVGIQGANLTLPGGSSWSDFITPGRPSNMQNVKPPPKSTGVDIPITPPVAASSNVPWPPFQQSGIPQFYPTPVFHDPYLQYRQGVQPQMTAVYHPSPPVNYTPYSQSSVGYQPPIYPPPTFCGGTTPNYQQIPGLVHTQPASWQPQTMSYTQAQPRASIVSLPITNQPLKVPPIRFRGEENENPADFKDTVKEYQAVSRMSDTDLLLVLPLMLEDQAKIWYRQNAHLILSWADFEVMFDRQYLDASYNEKILDKIDGARQERGDSPEEYLRKMIKLYQSLDAGERPKEKTMVRQIQKGLRPDIYGLLHLQKIATIRELQAELPRVMIALKAISQRQEEDRHVEAVRNVRFNLPSTKTTGQCFRCGSTAHFIRDCPRDYSDSGKVV